MKLGLNCTSRRQIYMLAVLNSFNNTCLPANTCMEVNIIQTYLHSSLFFVHLLLTQSIGGSSVISNFPYALICALYPSSPVRMTWVPHPVEPSGSTSTWQNQVSHSYHYGPSGAPELVMYILILRIFNPVSIHFGQRQ